MISTLLVAWALVVVTVTVHAAGLTVLLKSLMKSMASPPSSYLAITWRLIQVTWWLILIHLADILVWGLFFWWQDCMPDAESAFYFAGVTYTTTGYGDLLLQDPWRMLGPIEALTGILMCGLSAGVFFAIVSRIFRTRVESTTYLETGSRPIP